ncbi:hypothetical protein MBLNU457_6097t1 [Dothideomycetes sp. NU457]
MSGNGRPVRGGRNGYRPTTWSTQQDQQQQSSLAARPSRITPLVTSPLFLQNQPPMSLPTHAAASSSANYQIPARQSSAIPIRPPPAPSSTTQLERLTELSNSATARREAEARDAAAAAEEAQETSEVQEANELNTVLVEDSPEAAAAQPAQTQTSTLNAAAQSFVFPPTQPLVVLPDSHTSAMVVLPAVQQVLDLNQRMQQLHHTSPLVMTHQPGHGLASIPNHLPRPEYEQTATQILAQATRTTPATIATPERHVLLAPTGNRTILPAVTGLIRLGVGHVQPVFPGELKDDSLTQHMQQLARFGNADVVWTIYTDGRGHGRLARPDEIVLGGGDRGQNGSRVYYQFSPSISPRNCGGHAINTIDLYLESIALTMWVTRFEMDLAHIMTIYLVVRPAVTVAFTQRSEEQQLSPVLEQLTHRIREGNAPDPNRRFAKHNTGAMRALRDVWIFTVRLISNGANHGVRSVELPGVHEMLKAMNHLTEYMTLLEDEMARVMQTPGAQELVDAYMANGLTVEQLREFDDVAANKPDFRPENLEVMRSVSAHFGVPEAMRMGEVVVLRPTNYDFENPLRFCRPVERASAVGTPVAGSASGQNSHASRAGAAVQSGAYDSTRLTTRARIQNRPSGTRPRERLTDDQFRTQALRPTPGELSVLAPAHHRQQRSGLRANLWNGSYGAPPICNPFAPVRADVPVDNQDEAARTVADATPWDPEVVKRIDSLFLEE